MRHEDTEAIIRRSVGLDKNDHDDDDDPKRVAKQGGVKTIKPVKKGQKPIKFKEGGLHASTGTKPGQKISAAKHAEAASGKLGPKAQKQEQFFKNVLKG